MDFSAPCAAPSSATYNKTASEAAGPKIVYVFADLVEEEWKNVYNPMLSNCQVLQSSHTRLMGICPIAKLATSTLLGTRPISAFCQSFPERWCAGLPGCAGVVVTVHVHMCFSLATPPPPCSQPPHATDCHPRIRYRLCLHQWFLCKRHKYIPSQEKERHPSCFISKAVQVKESIVCSNLKGGCWSFGLVSFFSSRNCFSSNCQYCHILHVSCRL